MALIAKESGGGGGNPIAISGRTPRVKISVTKIPGGEPSHPVDESLASVAPYSGVVRLAATIYSGGAEYRAWARSP